MYQALPKVSVLRLFHVECLHWSYSPLLRDTLGLGICQGSFGTESADQGEAAVREGAGLCPTSVTSTV